MPEAVGRIKLLHGMKAEVMMLSAQRLIRVRRWFRSNRVLIITVMQDANTDHTFGGYAFRFGGARYWYSDIYFPGGDPDKRADADVCP